MNHFGTAFGVIVVTVIAGAFVVDRTVSKHEIATPPAARAAPAQPESNVSDASTTATPPIKIAELTPARPVSTAPAEARPKRTPARTAEPTQPAPAAAPIVDTPPATPNSDSSNVPSQSPTPPSD